MSEVVYCFGADVAVLAWIVTFACPKLTVVLEVGDIRPIMIERGFKGRLLRLLERTLLRRVSLLVVTSARFRDKYFIAQQRIPVGQVMVIENKVGALLLERATAVSHIRTVGGPIVIGYYGLIRCRKSWALLERLSSVAPDRFQVVVWGRLAMEEALPLDQLPMSMSYRGEYRNPDDVPAIYEKVDVVWGAHAHAGTNSRWARANRFYEACCFARPLIGQLGTADGEEIERRGIGLCVDLEKPDAALQQIMAISDDDLAIWTRASRELDPKVYAYSDEHDELVRRMKGFVAP
jgi:succinoglycan biosynthesis protein ExoL